MTEQDLGQGSSEPQKTSTALPYEINEIFDRGRAAHLDEKKVRLGTVHHALTEIDQRAFIYLQPDEFGGVDMKFIWRAAFSLNESLSWESSADGLPEDIQTRLSSLKESLKTRDMLDEGTQTYWREERDWVVEQFNTREELQESVAYFAENRELLLPKKEHSLFSRS